MNVSRCISVAMVVAFAATASAQDPLTQARSLYESAAYEEALSQLVRLKADAPAGATGEIDRYRVLCLMALSRTSEANQVIESIVINDPLYVPAVTEAAPRVRAAFSAVRQRVLPGLARSLYLDAKATFDRKAYSDAVAALEKTVQVIDNIEGANKTDLGDLRLLASGFLELSRASLAPRPAVTIEPPAATTSPAVEAPPSTPFPPSTNLVVLKQDVPPLPFSLTAAGKQEYRGLIEVEINEAGKVANVRLLQSVHALYDVMLLTAAREWTYEAPRIGGKPVATRKRVEIVLRP